MTPLFVRSSLTVAVSFVAGSVVIGVVLAAIAVLVCVMWRRSAVGGTTQAVATGPRTDSHAVMPADGFDPAAPTQPRTPRDRTQEPARTDAPVAPHLPNNERAPHPSGLGAAELAAMVEEGMASLQSDLDTLSRLIDSIASASAVPEDLPARPASQQVALVDQTAVMVASDLERAQRLAQTIAVDVGRGDRARTAVHDELARIGLPRGFFVAMDTTAADLAVDLVRARLAVERLVRRFEALSSLYSSVRPTLDLLADLGRMLARAADVADPWRQASSTVDLVPASRTAEALHR